MRRLAITNQKGGSCKTTTAVNLAAALAELNLRVLLIDLDPQASATAWLSERGDDDRLLEVLGGDSQLKKLIRPSTVRGLDLVPASAALARAARKADKVKSTYYLRSAVERLPADWDVLLIDCPPAMGFLSTSALVSSVDAVIPVEAHAMALTGVESVVRAVKRVHDRINPELAITAIVPCRVNRTRHAQEIVDRLRKDFGPLVVTVPVRESVRLAEAPATRKPITDNAPSSSGA